jgi:hypothetical protein
MRGLVWLLGGVVAGFLLGGIAPRRELAELRRDLDKARSERDQAQRRSKMTRLSPVPLLDEALRLPDEEPADGAGDGDSAVDPPSADAAAPGAEPEDVLAGFDVAVETQRVRVRQTRAAMREQADLDGEAMEEVDEIASDMNAALARHADLLVELGLAGEDAGYRDALFLAHEVTGVLYDAQERLDAVIGEEHLAAVDEEAQAAWNLVDLEAFRPALEQALAEPAP